MMYIDHEDYDIEITKEELIIGVKTGDLSWYWALVSEEHKRQLYEELKELYKGE